MSLLKLEPRFVERVWGTKVLEPWFPNSTKIIGEVWFETPDIPILVKFLFTTDKLSVQVHPEDEYAAQHHNGSPGKTEMWHILAAEPGATISAGFRENISPERAKQAALTGEIESLLATHDARPGDTFFINARTVHAIGAGITLCEIQQQSDVTYRLFDYERMGLDGKPRELHLDHGFTVSRLEPADVRTSLPVRCRYFVTERFKNDSVANCEQLLIAIGGSGKINQLPACAGDVFTSKAGTPLCIEGDIEFLRTYVPRT